MARQGTASVRARVVAAAPLPAAVLVAWLLAAALAAPGAHAATYAPCTLSLADRLAPGGTPAYNLHVERRATSCAAARRVMRAFHRCRTTARHRCPRPLAGGWRCRARRDGGAPTYRGRFSCAGPRGRAARGATRATVRGRWWQDTPGCLGAAARDPLLRCFSRARTLTPPPGEPLTDRSFECRDDPAIGACTFGVPAAGARRHVAIVGDSHVYHWRSALAVVAGARRWRAYSHSAPGCFYSTAAGGFSRPCADWYRVVRDWLRRHRRVDTVFVTANADTPVAPWPGMTARRTKIEGYRRALRALPPSVRHVVVLRDLTRSTQNSFDCVGRALAARRRLAALCSLPRSRALAEDLAAVAARSLRSPRYRVVDLVRHQCSATRCYPVVGGVLANGDVWGHMSTFYMRTLGPYLLRALRRARVVR